MSRLIDNLNFILNEKTDKIIPDNIMKDVTILGVTGTLELDYDDTLTPEEYQEALTQAERIIG